MAKSILEELLDRRSELCDVNKTQKERAENILKDIEIRDTLIKDLTVAIDALRASYGAEEDVSG